jgi:2-C-methyl-D-erythritol 4-phosphate cytidylyltransferase
LIERCLVAAQEAQAAVAAAPSTDTLKQVAGGRIVATLRRDEVWRAQTPQTFAMALIWRAYERAVAEGWQTTDDAALVERLGVKPVVVESDWTNLKITTAADLLVAEALLAARAG